MARSFSGGLLAGEGEARSDIFCSVESGNLMWGNRIAMRVSAEVLRQPVRDLSDSLIVLLSVKKKND